MSDPKEIQSHAEPVDPVNPLSDFDEGQWWVKELDAMSLTGTDDQKRAVSVVHNLLRAVAAQRAP